MLEGVLGLGIERLLVEKLSASKRMESCGEVSVVEIRNTPENRLGKPLADHRRRVQHALLPFRQAVDARCEDTLYRRWHADLLRGSDKAIRASTSCDCAC